MRKYFRAIRRLLLVSALVLVGCDALLPGPDDFEPTGTPYTLDSDIELVSITGGPRPVETGTYTLDMTCRSKSQGQETATLPAGLLFTSGQSRVQHMVMLKPEVIAVNTSTTVLSLGTFCCNEYRRTPDDLDTFELGPVTDNSGLREIINLVSDRDIAENLWMVQRAVWMVTDSTGLTDEYRDSLGMLPSEDRIQGPAGVGQDRED